MTQSMLGVVQVKKRPVISMGLLMLSTLVGAIALAGCNRTGGGSMGQAAQGDHREDQEREHPEQEHPEHEHFPSHWPEDILRASKRISALLVETAAPSTGSSVEAPAISPSGELADLIGWLPILAADSDLGREDFARIDAWSAAWTDRLRKHSSKSPGLDGISDIEGFKKVAAELEEICKAEQARIDELTRRFSE